MPDSQTIAPRAAKADSASAADAWAARVTRALRGGSREALAEVYDRLAESVARDVVKVTRRDESFALDCVQEMFMRLARNPPIAETETSLKAWMRTVALRVARSTVVSESRRRAREGAADTTVAREGHWSADDAPANIDEVLDAIDERLSADERALLDLRFHRGLPIAAIARSLGTGTARIDSAIRRALAKLRGIDGRNHDGGDR